MRKLIFLTILIIICIFLNSCGNLLEKLGVEPTYVQKMRGIWIVGGLYSRSYATAIPSVDLYDPQTDTWYFNVTTLPTPVSFAAVASHGGKIYVIGGFDASGNAVSNTQIYTVATDTWSSGASMLVGIANISAVTVYNKIYILGGSVSNAAVTWTYSDEAYAYNTVSDSWSTDISNNTNLRRSNLVCMPFNDIIYFPAGRTAVATVNNTVNNGYITSLANFTGVTEVAVPTGRAEYADVLYESSSGPARMVLVGGFTAITGVNTSLIFHSGTNVVASRNAYYLNFNFEAPLTWGTFADYPEDMGSAAAAVYNNSLYCFGGTGSYITTTEPIMSRSVYCLDLTNFPAGSWVQKADMLVFGRAGHTALTIRQ